MKTSTLKDILEPIILNELNGIKTNDNKYEIITKAGVLRVDVWNNNDGSILCHFVDLTAANKHFETYRAGYFQPNETNGKWNFHLYPPNPKQLVDIFLFEIKKIKK